MSESTAPDFAEGYPSSGERIGPAWSAVWSGLADGQWHWRAEMAAEYAPRFELVPVTVENLLRAAAHRGLIEARSRRGGPGASPRVKRAQVRRVLIDA